MLTRLDDYLIHQTPDTLDRVVTSDRNFYDRYYFNAHTPDGSAFLVVAMGIYPNIGVIDAFVTCVLDDRTQYIVRASRALGSDRGDTAVGPIRVDVLEGLRRFRITVEKSEHPIEMDMTFEATAPAFEEPHFFRRTGNRVMMDYTRLTQSGRWSGTLTAGGRSFTVEPSTWWGARDHSWGIRPTGGAEPPSAPPPGAGPGGFFWVWTPAQFDRAFVPYTVSEDPDGTRWHAACEVIPTFGQEGAPETLTVTGHDITLRPGTRNFERGRLLCARADGTPVTITLEPRSTIYMAGAGYAYFGGWRHGQYHAPLAIEGETWDLRDEELLKKIQGQTETVCDYTVEGIDGLGTGHGIIEFLLLGAYLPYGFKGFGDVAPERS